MSAVDPVAVVSADVWPPVLACDPGAMHTGLALRMGTAALEAVTVDRDEREAEADVHGTPRYASRVLDTVDLLIDRHRDDVAAGAARRGLPVPSVRVAVEGLVPPTAGHRAKGGVGLSVRVLSGLPATAAVLGAVLGRYPGAVVVAPAGGSRGWDKLDKDSYPGSLRGRTPPGWLPGGSERRHQRSAWAVAGQAHLIAPAPAIAPAAPAAPAVSTPAPVRSAPDQVGGTNLVRAVMAEPTTGDAETSVPTPERQQQLRLSSPGGSSSQAATPPTRRGWPVASPAPWWRWPRATPSERGWRPDCRR